MIAMGILVLFLQLGTPVLAQEEQREVEVKTDETLEKQVDQIMEKYIGEEIPGKEIPGASIGIVKDGEIILTKGYGVSDIEKKTPVDGGNTVFEVGSVTKLFTWSMLMKLAEEGKVKLDADIQEYLPEGTLNLTFDKKITILDLMSHTAGFEEKIEGMDLESVEQLKPLKETVTKENQPKQIYEPGTVTSYSNYGANLGGYIIEKVTGQNYTDYMNEFIHDQLQMDHSTFSMNYDDQLVIKDNLSLGYEPGASSIIEGKRFLGNDVPAGALLSTATDMSHFMLALLNDENEAPFSLFNQSDTLEQLETHSYSMVPDTPGNAHGFWEKEVANKRIIEHGGNTSSFTSQLSIAPEENLGYVLLTNVGGESTGIRKELDALLYGESLPNDDLTPKKSVTDKKLVGRYRTARTAESTMAKMYSVVFDSDIIITENKKGGVNVKLPGETEYIQYVEVNSGIYQKVGNEQKTTFEQSGLNLNHLYFELSDDGEVFRIGFGTIADYLPVTILNTQRFNLIAFVLSFVSFLATMIYLLIKFIREKRKKKDTNWSKNDMFLTIFSIIGLLVWVSAFVMTLKLAMDPTMIISSMRLLFYINWLLPLGTIAMSGYLVATWNKYKGKKLTIYLLLISLLTIIIFYNLNLFF